MASYLRPRRGKKATAISQNIILKRGEIFFEVPDAGVGKGAGKLKMGDGSTPYSSLPYFMEPTSVDVATSAISFTESSTTANATLLNEIASGAQLKTIVGSIKKLLRNLNSSVTSLNNDLGGFKFVTQSDGTIGYKKEGADTVYPFIDEKFTKSLGKIYTYSDFNNDFNLINHPEMWVYPFSSNPIQVWNMTRSVGYGGASVFNNTFLIDLSKFKSIHIVGTFSHSNNHVSSGSGGGYDFKYNMYNSYYEISTNQEAIKLHDGNLPTGNIDKYIPIDFKYGILKSIFGCGVPNQKGSTSVSTNITTIELIPK